MGLINEISTLMIIITFVHIVHLSLVSTVENRGIPNLELGNEKDTFSDIIIIRMNGSNLIYSSVTRAYHFLWIKEM